VRPRGFTLIEVLVALVIVAVGMSALMGALSSSGKTVVYMQDKTLSEWVALNQIASLRIALQKGSVPAVGKTNGDVEMANRTWHWAQEVVASQVPGIMRIDVKVRPKGVGSTSDDDNANWYVTVSGIAGSSLGSPGTGGVVWNPTAGTSQTPGGGSNQGTSLGGQNQGNSGGTGNTGNTGNQGSSGGGSGSGNPTGR
jgi:general secretion pathway protein I